MGNAPKCVTPTSKKSSTASNSVSTKLTSCLNSTTSSSLVTSTTASNSTPRQPWRRSKLLTMPTSSLLISSPSKSPNTECSLDSKSLPSPSLLLTVWSLVLKALASTKLKRATLLLTVIVSLLVPCPTLGSSALPTPPPPRSPPPNINLSPPPSSPAVFAPLSLAS